MVIDHVHLFSKATLNHSYHALLDGSGLVHPHYKFTNPAHPTYNCGQRCRKVFLGC